jgi:hypothetical protein
MRSRWVGVRACWRCCISVVIGYSSAVLCRLGVVIVDEIYPKRHFFCTQPMYPYQEGWGEGGFTPRQSISLARPKGGVIGQIRTPAGVGS